MEGLKGLPVELLGCILYLNTVAEKEPVVVGDCTVEGRVGNGESELRSLLGYITAMAGAGSLSVEEYSRERIVDRYIVHRATLLGGGEARLVEDSKGRPIVLALTTPPQVLGLPASRLEERLVIGEPLQPPVLAGEPSPAAAEAPGQRLASDFAVYAAEGVPAETSETLELRLRGVTRHLKLEELRDMAEWRRMNLHCVEGWTVAGREWLVVPLGEILGQIGATSRGYWMVAQSTGGYAAVAPLVEAAEAGYLALGLDGGELARSHGGPIRLLLPRLYGWKHVKWLKRITITETYVDGYWEARGYHERGRVELEERFKIRNPELLAE